MSTLFSNAVGQMGRTRLALSIVVAVAGWFGANSVRADERRPQPRPASKDAEADQAAKRAADDRAYIEYSEQRWKTPNMSTAEPTTAEMERRQVTKLRKAARAIDQLAAELESDDLFDEADQLFAQAQVLRSAARKLRRSYLEQSSSDATDAALQYNLHVLRSQIQLYQNQHGGQFPQVKPDADGNPSLPQLCESTNEKGESGTGNEHPWGPYILSLPLNPLAPDEKTRHTIIAIDHWPPKETSPKGGWFYHAPSGQIAPNAAGYFNE
jgi:hypothetical protein